MTNEESQITKKQEDITKEIRKKSKEQDGIIIKRKIEITKEELEDLYHKKLLTQKEIANIYGVNTEVIKSRMRRFSISIRSKSEQAMLKDGKTNFKEINQFLTYENLYNLYHKNGLSTSEIGKLIDVSAGTICDAMKTLRISRRSLINSQCNRFHRSDYEFLSKIEGLSSEQEDIIVGSLLGDGFLSKNEGYGTCSFRKTQKIANREYLEWTFEKLKPFSGKIITSSSNRKPIKLGIGNWGWEPCEKFEKTNDFYTRNHKIFSDLEKKWYKKDEEGNYIYKKVGDRNYRIKIVPRDLQLTPLSLAIWFCDDGCHNSKKRTAMFSTDGFSFEDVEFLIALIKNTFGLDCYLGKSGRKQPQIYFRHKDYFNFINLISPYVIWKCFNYKKDLTNFKIAHHAKKHSGYNCVIWNEKRKMWRVSIRVNKKVIELGHFKDLNEAINIRKMAEYLYE